MRPARESGRRQRSARARPVSGRTHGTAGPARTSTRAHERLSRDPYWGRGWLGARILVGVTLPFAPEIGLVLGAPAGWLSRGGASSSSHGLGPERLDLVAEGQKPLAGQIEAMSVLSSPPLT